MYLLAFGSSRRRVENLRREGKRRIKKKKAAAASKYFSAGGHETSRGEDKYRSEAKRGAAGRVARLVKVTRATRQLCHKYVRVTRESLKEIGKPRKVCECEGRLRDRPFM